ncbi:MAG TPA: HIT domain-containing protein [Acidimicrobiales bacterium]|nr:HIT domain-containing protein [Acidimicrobiales bacterium]
MSLERLWAGWRSEYIEGATAAGTGAEDCVMCRLADPGQSMEEGHVLWRGSLVAAALNAYPYTSGHLMVMPRRHVSDLEALEPEESAQLWSVVTTAVVAVKAAYRPEGLNLGINLGRAAGAGIPGHLHVHVLPRWAGDSNFMTSVAEARVMPETLSRSANRLRAVWPGPAPPG